MGKEKENTFSHIPVLLDNVLTGLRIKENGIYVDGTLGGAGHSAEIYKLLKAGMLIGIDQDKDAIRAGATHLNEAGADLKETDENDSDVFKPVWANSTSNKKRALIFRSN